MEKTPFKPWRVPSTTIRDKIIDAWKDMNAGAKDLVLFGILATSLIGAGIIHEHYWRNYTETGRAWAADVNTSYGQLKRDTTLSDYDRVEKIVSGFYGLR